MRFVLVPFILLISHALFFSAYSQQPYTLQENVRVPMRDGTSLSADVIIPGNITQGSVVLVVNCYPLEKLNTGMHHVVSRSGLILVEVANRGKAKSDGEFIPFRNDAQDNYDIIEWISKQPWCNGNVVMGGGSYLGFTQWAAAKTNHPSLKSIAPIAAAAPGIDFPMLNNMFSPYGLRWINYVTNNRYTDQQSFQNNKHWYPLYNKYYLKGQAFNRLDTLEGKPKKILQQWLEHPGFDTYWSETIPSKPSEFNRINIPVLTITGFFDADQRGAFYYYNNHIKHGPASAAKNHYLIIGPYDHAGVQSIPNRQYGDYTVDSAAIINMRLTCLQWFSHIANGKEKPSILKNNVNCFVMGSGWKHAASMADLSPDTLSFFLGQSEKSKFNRLSSVPVKKSGYAVIHFDSHLKTDSINTSEHDEVLNYENLKPFTEDYLKKPQSLFFDTDPLETDFELIGSPIAKLNLEFEKIKDCDLQVSYYEVTSDGKSYPLSNQRQRMSFLQDRTKRNLLVEKKVYHCTFENAYFIGKRLPKGSKIRLEVSVINSASFEKNYGSGKDISKETMADAQQGIIKLVMEPKRSCTIQLPGRKP